MSMKCGLLWFGYVQELHRKTWQKIRVYSVLYETYCFSRTLATTFVIRLPVCAVLCFFSRSSPIISPPEKEKRDHQSNYM